MRSNDAKGYALSTLSAITYGLIPLFTLPLMRKNIALDNILLVRFIIASLFLAIVMIFRKLSFKISFPQFLTLSTLALLFTGTSLALFTSYNYLPSGIATSIFFVYPIMVALLMRIIFKEKLKKVTYICMGAVILGVFVMFMDDGSGATLSVKGVLYVLLSALFYSFYIIVINKSNVSTMDGLKLTFYSMLITAFIYLIKATISNEINFQLDLGSWGNLILLGTIATALSSVTLAYAIQFIGATRTTVFGAVDPITAVVVGIIVFDEPFTWNIALGIVIILIAVTIMIDSSRFREFVRKLAK